jgi:hypothetical protein
MLMEWDPIGVAGVPEAADEYDCMIAPIMRQLSEGATAGPLAAWITGERVAHFGLDAQPEADNALALELVAWWGDRRLTPRIDVREGLAHEIPELPPDGSPVLMWRRHPAYPDGWWLIHHGESDGVAGPAEHLIGGEQDDVETAIERARARLAQIGDRGEPAVSAHRDKARFADLRGFAVLDSLTPPEQPSA